MRLLTWILFGFVAMLIGLGSYFVGVYQGKYSGWIEGKKPPLIQVEIAEKKVPVYLGTYCWAQKPELFSMNGQASCVDSISPQEAAKRLQPAVVPGGSTIHYEPPQRIKRFEPKNLTRPGDENKDFSYEVPTEKGKYVYSVQAEWAQGSAEYYFYLEVK